jgi:hypothetical protein
MSWHNVLHLFLHDHKIGPPIFGGSIQNIFFKIWPIKHKAFTRNNELIFQRLSINDFVHTKKMLYYVKWNKDVFIHGYILQSFNNNLIN